MDDLKFYIVLVAGLVPLITGFIWYNPKVFGTAWMNVTGITPEMGKSSNMAVTFGLTYVFSCLLGLGLAPIVIHQFGFFSMMQDVPGSMDPTTEIGTTFKSLMDNYGNNFRTFKHGAFHGVLAGIFIALPLIGINALFELKKAKYILLHLGYWILTLALMGGIICAFM